MVDVSTAAGNEKFCRGGCCWMGVKASAGEGRGSGRYGGAVEVGKKFCVGARREGGHLKNRSSS